MVATDGGDTFLAATLCIHGVLEVYIEVRLCIGCRFCVSCRIAAMGGSSCKEDCVSTDSDQPDGKIRRSRSWFGHLQAASSSSLFKLVPSIVDGISFPLSIVTDYIPLETIWLNRLNM